MALVTLCPGCGTTYKIYPEQLQAQNGLVRCGKCQIVFNGFSTLITIDESEIEYLPVSANLNSASEQSSEIKEAVDNLAVLDSVVGERQADANALPVFGNAHETAVQQTETAAGVAAVGPETTENTESGIPASDFLSDTIRERPARYWLWQVGSLLLFVAMMGQAIIAYRADLAVQLPQTRPYLEQLCNIFGCSVPLPANIQLLSIVSSDLQISDPENQPDVATLTAIIRNHATQAQALPALKLLLTDMNEQMLASRVFTAIDYLPSADRNKMSILPSQEITVRLYLDNSQIKPTGYRLQILYLE